MLLLASLLQFEFLIFPVWYSWENREAARGEMVGSIWTTQTHRQGKSPHHTIPKTQTMDWVIYAQTTNLITCWWIITSGLEIAVFYWYQSDARRKVKWKINFFLPNPWTWLFDIHCNTKILSQTNAHGLHFIHITHFVWGHWASVFLSAVKLTIWMLPADGQSWLSSFRHTAVSLTLPGIIALKRRKAICSVHPLVAFRLSILPSLNMKDQWSPTKILIRYALRP